MNCRRSSRVEPRPSRTALVGVLMLVAACAHGGPTPAPASRRAGDEVKLTFAWPEGFKAEVVVRHQSQLRGGAPAQVIARRVLSTLRRDGELWVATRDVIPVEDEHMVKSIRVRDAVIQVIDPRGTFVRAEGVDQALQPLKVADEAARAAMRRALIRDAVEDWEVMVAAWAGQTLQEGKPLHKQFQGSVPLVPMARSLLDVEYGLEGRVPCTPDETERRCVALYYRARPAASDRENTLQRMRALEVPGEPVTEYFRGGFEITLFTEPDTLIPHRVVSRERLRVRLALPDGHVREVEETSDDEYVFVQDRSAGT